MRLLPALSAFALTCMLAACGGDAKQPRLSGVLLDGTLDETSGLAASGRFKDTFWLLQDGGNPAQLHAVSRRGTRKATVTISGVHNTDWEDLAAFAWEGKRYLLIADTGDNGGLRRSLQLHVVPEPDRLVDGATLKPAWSIAFKWPDGPRDCEAVTVDAATGTVLLVSKKRNPPELFALPLRPGRGLVVARRIALLTPPPAAPDGPKATDADKRRTALGRQVTAADLSPDDRTLAILTYDRLWLYPRAAHQSWAQAVGHAPRTEPLPWLHQAEALAWMPDGKGLLATGEFSPAPLVYLPADP
ncbi:hypothetical protein LYSHEL_03150 [Lysobacter helvus]|uniref:Integral membrane protein n=2 Tax=Lysobacteraceae TaxID=32033 RepID=A0ABM7Q257_9GAMM|nr:MULTISPECIES: hypothetical protein [Lysobacter]BCT91291.1 hypothetical protein LYSCAS_03150 [Lysobacter caseinilyticus]BCT94444.1 hypothetical protein LYSHEL_03150 [Lysobacter helvus]